MTDITVAQRVKRSGDLTTHTLDDWLEPCPATHDNDVGKFVWLVSNTFIMHTDHVKYVYG